MVYSYLSNRLFLPCLAGRVHSPTICGALLGLVRQHCESCFPFFVTHTKKCVIREAISTAKSLEDMTAMAHIHRNGEDLRTHKHLHLFSGLMDEKGYVCISMEWMNGDHSSEWKLKDSKIWGIQTNWLHKIREKSALEQEALVTFYLYFLLR